MQALSFKLFFILSISNFAFSIYQTNFEIAEQYYKNFEYSKALAAYFKIYKSNPKLPLVISKIAELKLIQENKENAINFLLENIPKISKQDALVLKSKLSQLGEIFLTEEAQSSYLQGVAKKDSARFDSALNSFKTAIALEPVNFLILKEKARSESELKLYSEAYETLKSFYALNPYNKEIQIQLIELQYYLKKNKELIETFSKQAFEENDLKLWVGLSYLEISDHEKANLYLKSYFDRSRSTQDPLFYYVMGKIQLTKGYKKEANIYFDKFLNLSKIALKKTDNSLDKYRLEEKQIEVKKIFDSK